MHHRISAPEKSQAIPIGGGKAYYAIQLTAWGLYGILQYLLSSGSDALRVVTATAWCGTGMLGTHFLRWYANRRAWNAVPQLVVPFAVAALVIPAAMNAARLTVSTFLFDDHIVVMHVLLAQYVRAVLVVSVWCAVFVTVNETNRRRQAETEALRLALIAQVSQYRALRSQLNPHFLFNCLNGLRELVDEDRDRAKLVIDLLSELLRYTLRADRIETVSLREELRAVNDYLSLEKVRFEDRLRIRFDIDPRSLEAKVPPMLLQTLAENGVKHGIAKLPAGGELEVVSQVLEGNLRVEVTNTGKLSAATQDPTSLGLDNARERLRMMYGEGASLTLTAKDENKVCATVVVPVHSNGLGS